MVQIFLCAVAIVVQFCLQRLGYCKSFEGVLTYEHWLNGTSIVQIKGCFDSHTNKIKAEETNILSEPWKGYWRLGTISGCLSSSGDFISGIEEDSRGEHSFSFDKVSL